jgi:oxygen-independent coproporphyrinogen-3 oxidase
LGRAHDARAALDALHTALDSGIGAICADLIFGLPGRCAADSVRELQLLPLSELAHVSAYALTIEPNTPFGARARKGTLELAPDEAVTESFVAVHDALEHSGFEHYEISNYARPTCRSVHNSGYWHGRDYLGLGVAAWGTVRLRYHALSADRGEHVRYRNTTRIEKYLALGAQQATPLMWSLQSPGMLAERENIDSEIALVERIMLGLRTREGVDLAALAIEFDMEAWMATRRKTLQKLQASGRIAIEATRLSIPFPMWYLADGTISQLI